MSLIVTAQQPAGEPGPSVAKMDRSDERWTELCDKFATAGYQSLSWPEKDWVNLRSLIDSISAGAG